MTQFRDGRADSGMRAMIAARDWSGTPLGPREAWPAELSVALGLCLDSGSPSALYWGPEFHMLYNDAKVAIVGDHHPSAFGTPVSEGRADAWNALEPLFAGVVASGEGVVGLAMPLPVRRGNRNETVWLNYSITPIRGQNGAVLGLLTQTSDVSAAVQARAALASSEERLRIALAASHSVGTWDWDVAANHGVADARFAEMLDVSPEAVQQGAGIGEFLKRVHPDDRTALIAAYERSVATQEDFQAEYRIGGADGHERWVVSQGRCSFVDGEPRRFSGVTFDLTPQKRAEQALRRAKDERDFVLALTERQRGQADADGVMQLTAEAIAQRLGASRAGCFRVLDDDMLEFGACWTDGRVPALTGTIRGGLLGPYFVAHGQRNSTMVFADAEQAAVTAAAFARIDTRAAIGVPLVRDGVWSGGFFVTEPEVRAWTSDEIALVEEVAQLCWDSSARIEALRRLRERNRSLAGEVAATAEERDLLWEASRDLIGVIDADGVIVRANPAWTRTLGWPVDQIVGRTSEWLLHPDDIASGERKAVPLYGPDGAAAFERRLRTAAGDYVIVAWTGSCVDGRIYCSGRDVTEERMQQAALREAEELSRLAMATVNGVGKWSYDTVADRLVGDAGFATLYGLDARDLAAGLPAAAVMRNIHPDDRADAERKALATRAHEGYRQSEYRIVREDGSVRWVLSRNHTIAGPDGSPRTAIGIALDMTEQRAMADQLRQAQKMEAVGQLTGGLAHDFNNLLTAISGAMEMLHVRLGQGRIDALSAYVDAAQSATRRAAALTHRLLAFSRRQTLDPRPTDVNRLIGEIEELVRRTAGPGVAVAVDLDPGLPRALVDANQLENALLNLCINARDAMQGAGTIDIVTRTVALDAAAAGELEVVAGDYLRIDIVDAGSGMAPEVVARAFDPFFTTKPMGEGTGLGLSMIYGFARQSGGQIAVDSAVGRGTRMSLYLPRHAGAVLAPLDAAPARVNLAPGKGQTILVVDDEPAVRMLVTDALTELDYVVLAASDGAGAVVILESDAAIDLLVTDVGLPGGINGRQVADAARAVRPELGVLFITGYAENAVIGSAPLEPGMELLTKPFSIEALGARVADMVARVAR